MGRSELRDQISVYGPAVALVAIAFWAAYQFVDPAPPSRFTIATARTDGAYYRFAERYRDILAREGVTLDIRTTAGSVENLSLLADAAENVPVAFVQSGAGSPVAAGTLVSLASLYFEPLWVFHREAVALADLGDLRGRRVSVGTPGSGTRAVALRLLANNEVTQATAALEPLGGQDAADALVAGALDAAFFVASSQSPTVDRLLRTPGVQLLSFARAPAYARIHRFLSRVTLPRGVLDLKADIPPHDVELLAPAATLVARSDFHPALVDLLLRAATQVHSEGGLFERFRQFPSAEYVDLPMSEEAERFLRSGPSFLQRFLPFWAATLVDRMLVMLLPLVALIIPLARILPPVYRWRIRSRIYRWYGELLSLDPAVAMADRPATAAEPLRELERIEREVAKVRVPMAYADELYALRVHINLIRDELLSPSDESASGRPSSGAASRADD